VKSKEKGKMNVDAGMGNKFRMHDMILRTFQVKVTDVALHSRGSQRPL